MTPTPISLQRVSFLLLMVLILLLGWTLRLDELETRSLWEDEGWTMLLSRGPGLDDVVRSLKNDQHPPLYFMVLRVWRDIAGDTEFATRFLGVLIGMLAVAGIYPLGRSLFGAAAGILAALLLALADLPVDLSQEVRHYAAMMTLVVFSSLFYVRWWLRPTTSSRVGYVLTSVALLYTHYLSAFVLLAQGVHALLTARPWPKLRESLILFALVGLGFLPWVPVVLDQNSVRWDNPLYYQNALPNSIETYRTVRTAVFGSHFGLMAGLMLLGLVYITYSGPRARARWKPAGPLLYPALWIGLMAGLTVLINERSQFLTVRNFLLIMPAVALLIGHGLTNLHRAARLFLVAVIVVVSLTTVDARRFYPDWRAVTRNVTGYHLPGEPVLMDIWVGDFPVRYYIDRQMGEDTPRVSLREWRDEYRDQFLPALLAYLQSIDAFWLVYWGDKPMDEYGGLIAQAGFVRTAALSVDHLGTPLYSYRYDRTPETTLAVFGDVLALRDFDAPSTAAPGDTLRVALWWTANQPPPLDYSVSVFLLGPDGTMAAQHDGPPLDGVSPTTTWTPGDLKYDLHEITLPKALPPGEYALGVKIYWYGDGQPLPVNQPAGDYAVLGSVRTGS